MTRNQGVAEWGDPYPIVDATEQTAVPERQRRAILEAVVAAYEDQHTTTPLDAGSSFRIERITPLDENPVTECEFEVQRFVRGTPAGRHSGHASLTDDGWQASYENRSWGRDLLDSLRSVLPSTSAE
ncbi:hypothetical protein [Halobacterium yunchengense]|uniref:hypothetical protein n=1 Tax=Halobacterium yunchengense TaxID=3108497 RepID=UPI003009755E